MWVGASSRLQMFHQWELNPRHCCNIWKAPALSFPQHVVLFHPRIFKIFLYPIILTTFIIIYTIYIAE